MSKITVPYCDDFAVDYDTVDYESPHRVIEVWLKIRDMVDFVAPEQCSLDDLFLCHSERIVKMVERDAQLFSIARRAVGGAVAAARYALEGRHSFALVRPPGHHAGHNFNGGFCFFNNMAIAISKLFSENLINTALIVDIDLHYGNGTSEIFRDDPRVAFRNIDAGTRDEFFEDLRTAVMDGSSFDIVGCSAGFDTYIRDWGALLYEDDYRNAGRLIASANPRSFSILEGGYYINDLGLNVRAYLEGVLEACS